MGHFVKCLFKICIYNINSATCFQCLSVIRLASRNRSNYCYFTYFYDKTTIVYLLLFTVYTKLFPKYSSARWRYANQVHFSDNGSDGRRSSIPYLFLSVPRLLDNYIFRENSRNVDEHFSLFFRENFTKTKVIFRENMVHNKIKT